MVELNCKSKSKFTALHDFSLLCVLRRGSSFRPTWNQDGGQKPERLESIVTNKYHGNSHTETEVCGKSFLRKRSKWCFVLLCEGKWELCSQKWKKGQKHLLFP